MTEEPSRNDTPTQTKATANAEVRAAEAAAIRRRWITLGEILAVIAVLISGLTLWNSWSERSATEARTNADARQSSARAASLVLLATSSGDHELLLKPVSADQSVQSQTMTFPTALGVAAAETTGEPRIEAAWFEDALKTARNHARLPDDSRGDERLPIAISTRFLVDGEPHEDMAIYDVGYSISGRWLSGHKVALRGLSFVSHVKGSHAQTKLDARWKAVLASKRGAAGT
ncbi:hypothetical protein LWE61_09170 [Sphingobium sufflavum]|uniref:hypothetical protein n=1 Tax=Sphingobium sufflavum TaxID=1129547 RepID=UPI001F44143F|nr:hypothetical protein [Sphingobium sufflavum]MCE7796728.1 hypothetical protein [Sphingobium sufflavum]